MFIEKMQDMVKGCEGKMEPINIIENLKKEHTVYTIDGKKIANELGNSKVLNSVV